jgi:hypothetical protein
MTTDDFNSPEPVVDPRTMSARELLIRMDGRITTMWQLNSGVMIKQGDQESRLRLVEKKVWLVFGAAPILGLVGSQIPGLIPG